jgi:23S rRNA-intervening sequence protein
MIGPRAEQAPIRRFEDPVVWQKARNLTKGIYALSAQGPLSRDFGLRDQLRRAAVSIMSNIAEAFEGLSGLTEEIGRMLGRMRRTVAAQRTAK